MMLVKSELVVHVMSKEVPMYLGASRKKGRLHFPSPDPSVSVPIPLPMKNEVAR